MTPPQFLVTLILTGLFGSVVLVALFFGVLRLFIRCPSCRTRTSRRARHCHECGVRLAPPGSGRGDWPAGAQARAGEPVTAGSLALDALFEQITALDTEQRACLNDRLRAAAQASRF